MTEDKSPTAPSASVLDDVFETIRERQRLLPEGSYVTHLLKWRY